MSSGDSGEAPAAKGKSLLTRGLKKTSYFLDHEVSNLLVEQNGLFGAKLAEIESANTVNYDPALVSQFETGLKMGLTVAQIVNGTDKRFDISHLRDSLETLALNGDKEATTRLLDFLFVTRQSARVVEALQLQGLPADHYDLWAATKEGPWGSLAVLTSLMQEGGVRPDQRRERELVSLLTMVVSEQEELVAFALTSMATQLGYYWDALLLSLHLHGGEHALSVRLRALWKAAVENDERWRVMRMAGTLSADSLDEVACQLISSVSNKNCNSSALLLGYRCLATELQLLAASTKVSPIERTYQTRALRARLLAVYVQALGLGFVPLARGLLPDLCSQQRAEMMGVPEDIWQVHLKCHADLTEALQKAVMEGGKGVFSSMAAAWQEEIARPGSEMDKLRTSSAGARNELQKMSLLIAAQLVEPLRERGTLSRKMECAYVAADFLPEMVRWASRDQNSEEQKAAPLQLEWRHPHFEIAPVDDAIVPMSVVEGRSRATSVSASSVRSAVSAATVAAALSRENSKQQLQQQKREEPKAALLQPPVGMVQDVRKARKEESVQQQQPKSAAVQPELLQQQRNEQPPVAAVTAAAASSSASSITARAPASNFVQQAAMVADAPSFGTRSLEVARRPSESSSSEMKQPSFGTGNRPLVAGEPAKHDARSSQHQNQQPMQLQQRDGQQLRHGAGFDQSQRQNYQTWERSQQPAGRGDGVGGRRSVGSMHPSGDGFSGGRGGPDGGQYRRGREDSRGGKGSGGGRGDRGHRGDRSFTRSNK